MNKAYGKYRLFNKIMFFDILKILNYMIFKDSYYIYNQLDNRLYVFKINIH